MTRVSNTSLSSLSGKRLDVPLAKLISQPHNPRRTKPDRDAHRRLVASVRSHGLLEPLVISNGRDDGLYSVIAGKRRLAALREIYKGQNPKVPCTLKAVEGDAAEAVSLAENFAREPMHPLDEAEAFARLAKNDGKGAEDIASQFGVTPAYVRQRMKLSALAEVVKSAYRQGAIDTGTAEAFAAVPAERQQELWMEFKGPPQHAQQVRNLIAHAWIDAALALFDVATLPEGTVSRDLFGDRVLIERQAFMEAQAQAMRQRQAALQEDGWKEVALGQREDLYPRLQALDLPPQEFDGKTTKKLGKIDELRQRLEKTLDKKSAPAVLNRTQARLASLDAAEERLTSKAPEFHSEATKAVGTAFLILDPDGRVYTEYRIARTPKTQGKGGANGKNGSENGGDEHAAAPKPPTPSDMSDPQKATLYTQQALAVRAALLDHPLARKRLLVMILHDKVRSEAFSIRHEANGTTLCVENTQGLASPALQTLRKRLSQCDPFKKETYLEDTAAYRTLLLMSEKELDTLIAVLVAQTLTAHLSRPTPLVGLLANELKVDLRKAWKPDDVWLSGYTKLQLADLLDSLRGPAYGNAAASLKKSELVTQTATLFAEAAAGKVTDAAVAKRVNKWLPTVNADPVAAQYVQGRNSMD